MTTPMLQILLPKLRPFSTGDPSVPTRLGVWPKLQPLRPGEALAAAAACPSLVCPSVRMSRPRTSTRPARCAPSRQARWRSWWSTWCPPSRAATFPTSPSSCAPTEPSPPPSRCSTCSSKGEPRPQARPRPSSRVRECRTLLSPSSLGNSGAQSTSLMSSKDQVAGS